MAGVTAQTGSITGIVVATPGWYTFKVAIESKNASSSNYAYEFGGAIFTRTGA